MAVADILVLTLLAGLTFIAVYAAGLKLTVFGAAAGIAVFGGWFLWLGIALGVGWAGWLARRRWLVSR